MATTRDYYDILGVGRNASETEIKQAFRRLAREYHPDVNKSTDAEARFKEINEAYAVLGDAQKRAQYDRFGHAGANGAGFDFSDLGGFADIFETFFGASGRRGTGRGPQRGADLRYDMRISFEEAVFGADKEISIPVRTICEHCGGNGAEPGTGSQVCPRCHGSGELRRVQQSVFGQFVNVVLCDRCGGDGQVVGTPCAECHGEGRATKNKTITVAIPAGVDRGQQIRLAGEGEFGPKGGPPGDLYIVLDVDDSPLFRREGYDIFYDLPLNVAQATLGDEVVIPTLDGEEELRIPAGTQSGEKIRLRGKGVPHLRSKSRGDMFVVSRVETPRKLSKKQRELFEELARELGKAREDKGLFDKFKEAVGG